MPNTYALIMAGGAGTRLWPLSRKTSPKPLIPLVEAERTMFQIAVQRLDGLLDPDHILVVANAELTPKLQAQAPEIPAENFIIEPMGRDTAPAVGLGAIHVRSRDPEGVMAVLTADHHIADEATFRQVLFAAASAAAQDNAAVTLGIHPAQPSTGFGYIERGAVKQQVGGIDLYELRRFVEKPDQATAEGYLASGNYSWNSGMFIWRVARVMDEFATHASDIASNLETIAAAIGTPDYQKVLAETWPNIRKTSVDYALMEHIQEAIYVIPVEMGWTDIGNFNTLFKVLSAGPDENVHLGGQSPVLLDTHGTLIVSKRLVATIGLADLAIIDTDDALLICHRDRVQDVKKVVELLKMEKRDSTL